MDGQIVGQIDGYRYVNLRAYRYVEVGRYSLICIHVITWPGTVKVDLDRPRQKEIGMDRQIDIDIQYQAQIGIGIGRYKNIDRRRQIQIDRTFVSVDRQRWTDRQTDRQMNGWVN